MIKQLTSLSTILFLFISCKTQETSYGTTEFKQHTFDYYVVNLEEDSLQFFWKDTNDKHFGSFENLKNNLEKESKRLLFAMNGGMYMEDRQPLGLYIEKGKQLRPLNTRDASGNFYLKPNGVFLIGSKGAKIVQTEVFQTLADSVFYATQSGPALLLNDTIHPVLNEGSKNKHIRNGVGVINENHVVFAISNQTVNFYDFALFFKEEFGCSNALYLDGFVSRTYIANYRNELGGNFGCIIGVFE